MSKTALRILKVVVFVFCLLPLAGIVSAFIRQQLGADPIADITHYTGFWAVYLLLASLAITPLRRIFPKLGWLIRFRRMLGLYAFFYATLHLLTYIFLFSGYDIAAALDGIRAHHYAVLWQQWKLIWPVMVSDAQRRPFIQVGLVAWFILLLLAVTSPQWVLRKMGGPRWQLLHRTVYLAAILAVIHYWWIVKTGVLDPWKDTAVLAILLLIRVFFWWKKRSASTPVPTSAGSRAT